MPVRLLCALVVVLTGGGAISYPLPDWVKVPEPVTVYAYTMHRDDERGLLEVYDIDGREWLVMHATQHGRAISLRQAFDLGCLGAPMTFRGYGTVNTVDVGDARPRP